MRQIFPDREIVELPDDDPMFLAGFAVGEKYQVGNFRSMLRNGNTYRADGSTPHWRAIRDDKGRVMVAINFNNDLGDSWQLADDPRYPEKFSYLGIRLGINYVIYAMTSLRMEQIATKVGPAGIDIAYQRLGNPDAPVVLLIMGIAAQSIHWPEAFCRTLIERGLQVVLFDNRDSGLSTHLASAARIYRQPWRAICRRRRTRCRIWRPTPWGCWTRWASGRRMSWARPWVGRSRKRWPSSIPAGSAPSRR